MRRITLLILLITFIGGGLYSQNWMRYDADVLPTETSGNALDLSDLSQDTPGDNFVEELAADPDIAGNSLFRYIQPDEEASGGGGDANRMYRFNFEDANGNDAPGTRFTLVTRLKGLDNWSDMGLDRVFDLQLRNGASGTRDELRLGYDGNVIELDRAEVSINSAIDLTDWHIYRLVVDSNEYSVYVDEASDPVIAGTSTVETEDRYLKIGDGSGDKIGGMVDWVALDTTGAYSPVESPLDDSFTGVGGSSSEDFDPTAYSILFLTKDVTEEGTLEEQGIIDDLRSRGFTVHVTYNNPGSIVVPADVEFSFETADNYDLIIIGRGISSGDFTEIADWAALETPVIHFSAYIMRNNRLDLINSSSASREVEDATTVDMERVADVKITNHPIFTGVDSNADTLIGYHTWFYDFIGYGADTFEMNHNATLLGSWSTGSAGDGNVALAMWDAGIEAYPGSQATPQGKRVYFQMGADDNSSPKLRNFTAFTDESTLVFHNLLKMLLGATPDGQIIPIQGKESLGKIAFVTKDVDEAGNLEEIEIIAELRKRGYQVDVTYNNAGSITVPVDFDFSFEALNDYDVVILGRGVSSGDFTEAESWAAVQTPIIIFSSYLVRNSRLKLINSSSATREVDDGTTINMDRVTNVSIVDHPIFTGLDEDMDGQIGYHTWFYDYVVYGVDSFEMNHNATLLATLSAAGGPGDSSIYMAHWDAGVEAYPDAGDTLAGPRLYMQMGSDDNSSPKVRNFTAFTDESLIALFNALSLLQGETPTGVLPEAGPVALWNMDEGDGTVVSDVIGGANGSIMNGNGITWESCGVGNSLNFSGSTKDNAIIYVNDNPNIDFSDQSFSISLLAKIDPHAQTGEMNLLLKGDNKNDGTGLPNGNGHWYSIATKDGELRFAIDDDITKTQLGVAIDETMFPPDSWNHIVGVRDRTLDSLFLYLNGVKVGSILDETEEAISTTGLPLVMGNYHSGVRKINGGIDEVGIYDFAFSTSEVASLFSNVAADNDCEVLSTIVELSNDASLSSLEVSAGSLDPAFDPAITSYSVVVPEGTTSVVITAVANHPNATVTGDGEYTNIPGATVVTVTAEDSTTQDYSLSFTIEGQGNSRTVIEPGFETLWTAIRDAVSGDTLVLKNGEVYTPIESYQINKNIVIIAETIPELPALENMPIIENLFGPTPLFQLQNGGHLTLIGIDVDGQGATNLFDTDPATGSRMSVYINRCRLHNTLDDIFDDAPDGGTSETRLERCILINSFIYDSGSGHGFYIKNFFGESEFIFENNTFWNMGEQFNWIRHYPAGILQSYLYNHNTGYYLSTDLADDKELFGNSDAPDAESMLDIDFKNSILHTQLSANEGSLKFNNTSEAHSIDIINNVLFNVAPIFDLGGTINKEGNMVDVDPQFVDPDNGDFTVMNTDLYTAADDGEIVGALYWHPDFVDDFSDLVTSTNDNHIAEFKLQMSPNPFSDQVIIDFELEKSERVQLLVYDFNGKRIGTLMNSQLPEGVQRRSINTQLLNTGNYVFLLKVGGKTAALKMIKVN